MGRNGEKKTGFKSFINKIVRRKASSSSKKSDSHSSYQNVSSNEDLKQEVQQSEEAGSMPLNNNPRSRKPLSVTRDEEKTLLNCNPPLKEALISRSTNLDGTKQEMNKPITRSDSITSKTNLKAMQLLQNFRNKKPEISDAKLKDPPFSRQNRKSRSNQQLLSMVQKHSSESSTPSHANSNELDVSTSSSNKSERSYLATASTFIPINQMNVEKNSNASFVSSCSPRPNVNNDNRNNVLKTDTANRQHISRIPLSKRWQEENAKTVTNPSQTQNNIKNENKSKISKCNISLSHGNKENTICTKTDPVKTTEKQSVVDLPLGKSKIKAMVKTLEERETEKDTKNEIKYQHQLPRNLMLKPAKSNESSCKEKDSLTPSFKKDVNTDAPKQSILNVCIPKRVALQTTNLGKPLASSTLQRESKELIHQGHKSDTDKANFNIYKQNMMKRKSDKSKVCSNELFKCPREESTIDYANISRDSEVQPDQPGEENIVINFSSNLNDKESKNETTNANFQLKKSSKSDKLSKRQKIIKIKEKNSPSASALIKDLGDKKALDNPTVQANPNKVAKSSLITKAEVESPNKRPIIHYHVTLKNCDGININVNKDKSRGFMPQNMNLNDDVTLQGISWIEDPYSAESSTLSDTLRNEKAETQQNKGLLPNVEKQTQSAKIKVHSSENQLSSTQQETFSHNQEIKFVNKKNFMHANLINDKNLNDHGTKMCLPSNENIQPLNVNEPFDSLVFSSESWSASSESDTIVADRSFTDMPVDTDIVSGNQSFIGTGMTFSSDASLYDDSDDVSEITCDTNYLVGADAWGCSDDIEHLSVCEHNDETYLGSHHNNSHLLRLKEQFLSSTEHARYNHGKLSNKNMSCDSGSSNAQKLSKNKWKRKSQEDTMEKNFQPPWRSGSSHSVPGSVTEPSAETFLLPKRSQSCDVKHKKTESKSSKAKSKDSKGKTGENSKHSKVSKTSRLFHNLLHPTKASKDQCTAQGENNSKTQLFSLSSLVSKSKKSESKKRDTDQNANILQQSDDDNVKEISLDIGSTIENVTSANVNSNSDTSSPKFSNANISSTDQTHSKLHKSKSNDLSHIFNNNSTAKESAKIKPVAKVLPIARVSPISANISQPQSSRNNNAVNNNYLQTGPITVSTQNTSTLSTQIINSNNYSNSSYTNQPSSTGTTATSGDPIAITPMYVSPYTRRYSPLFSAATTTSPTSAAIPSSTITGSRVGTPSNNTFRVINTTGSTNMQPPNPRCTSVQQNDSSNLELESEASSSDTDSTLSVEVESVANTGPASYDDSTLGLLRASPHFVFVDEDLNTGTSGSFTRYGLGSTIQPNLRRQNNAAPGRRRSSNNNGQSLEERVAGLRGQIVRVPGVLILSTRRNRIVVYLSQDRPNIEGVLEFMQQNGINRADFEVEILPWGTGRRGSASSGNMVAQNSSLIGGRRDSRSSMLTTQA